MAATGSSPVFPIGTWISASRSKFGLRKTCHWNSLGSSQTCLTMTSGSITTSASTTPRVSDRWAVRRTQLVPETSNSAQEFGSDCVTSSRAARMVRPYHKHNHDGNLLATSIKARDESQWSYLTDGCGKFISSRNWNFASLTDNEKSCGVSTPLHSERFR